MKSYTVQYLAYTLADLTGGDKAANLALHLGKMSQEEKWDYVSMHPVGDGILVVFSHDLAGD